MRLRALETCDPHELDKLEAKLRIELPKQYRQWLLNTNGGIAEDLPFFTVPNNPYSDAETLRTLLGITPSHGEIDIETTIHKHLWVLRQDHIPIGWSEGSGLLSIELTNWSDRVYFFEYCDEGEQNGLRTPYLVAESIYELIDSLQNELD